VGADVGVGLHYCEPVSAHRGGFTIKSANIGKLWQCGDGVKVVRVFCIM